MKWVWTLLILIGLLATAARFYRLDEAPPGFYVDEAAVAAQVLCLKQSGRNLDGMRWPLFTSVLGGGYSSFAWQAPAALWSVWTGASIAAMRSFSALCGVLTVLGVFCLGLWATNSMRIATVSAVAMAISPWAFQFSRIAWDPAIAPLYLTWGLAFLFLWLRDEAKSSRPRWWWGVLATLILVLGCLSYAPVRVQLPLVLAFFAWWKRAQLKQHLPEVVAFSLLFLLLSGPLWLKTHSGEIQGRFEALSVFGTYYWSHHGVASLGGRVALGFLLFVQNFLKHFSPGYLLLKGDENLRHSTQSFGEWSWLDAAAVVAFTSVMVWRRKRPDNWILFLLVGYAAGVCPAALTWESVPHALRSFGAAPFLALFVGTATEELRAEFKPGAARMLAAAGGVGLVFSVFFWRDYFGAYPERAGPWFDRPTVEAIQRYEALSSLQEAGSQFDYPALALRYFELRSGAMRCAKR